MFTTEQLKLPSDNPVTYCRLCLANDGELLHVFPAGSGDDAATVDDQLPEKILDCTSIRLTLPGDGACVICQRCLGAVNDFFRFRLLTRQVNALIKVTDAAPTLPTPLKAIRLNGQASKGGGPSSFHCRYCPKSFRAMATMAEHTRRQHASHRQHQCQNCLEQFQHAPSLARHVRNRTCHTFTRYRCRVCAECFHERDRWADHIRVHAKDFPHQCPDCLSQFKHKATLRRHVNTVHLLLY